MYGVDPYASGVLKPDYHGPLVANLSQFAAEAGITHDFVWTSMRERPHTKTELDYIVSFRRQASVGCFGLLFEGDNPKRDVYTAMALMAGALMRSYIKARVMGTEEVIDYIAEHGFPEHTALLVPDFLLTDGAGSIYKQRIAKMVGLLLHRRQQGLQTVIYAPSLDEVRAQYGGFVGRLIEECYLRAPINPE